MLHIADHNDPPTCIYPSTQDLSIYIYIPKFCSLYPRHPTYLYLYLNRLVAR